MMSGLTLKTASSKLFVSSSKVLFRTGICMLSESGSGLFVLSRFRGEVVRAYEGQAATESSQAEEREMGRETSSQQAQKCSSINVDDALMY